MFRLLGAYFIILAIGLAAMVHLNGGVGDDPHAMTPEKAKASCDCSEECSCKEPCPCRKTAKPCCQSCTCVSK